MKGKENYSCSDNGCSASQSTCSIRGGGVTPKSLVSDSGLAEKYGCSKSCSYVADYVKAMNAPITLMTYQMYFIQRNYVEDSLMHSRNCNFPARDLVICDECHNLCAIAQAHFAPQISFAKPSYMKVLEDYIGERPSDLPRSRAVSGIMSAQDSTALIEKLGEYEAIVGMYLKVNEHVRGKLAAKAKLTDTDRAVLAAGNRARREHCKLDDILKFVREQPYRAKYVCKTRSDDGATINYVFDDAMLRCYFHWKSKCELLMSATVGDFREYAKISGLELRYVKTMSIPSAFDFSRSPIYVSLSNKMSYVEKAASMPRVVLQTDAICKFHRDARGIIQTGSYINAEILRKSLPRETLSRCVFYSGARDKDEAMREFVSKPGKILVGPTLLEGLNFPDGLCRFQICVKVPYANLSSEYVKLKKRYVPSWYRYDVLNKLTQGRPRDMA